jgi:hypothetical protein
MRDSLSNQFYVPMIAPVVIADNTPAVSGWLSHNTFEALTFGILTGILADADATFAVLMEEADASDFSDAAPVADSDMISQTVGVAPEAAASFTFANDGQARRIAYIGNKAFVRITITPTGNSGSAPIAVFADCSDLHSLPAY